MQGVHLTLARNEFDCPHECGKSYSNEEGNYYAEQIHESKSKTGIIHRKSKCCKRTIYMCLTHIGIAVWKKND